MNDSFNFYLPLSSVILMKSKCRIFPSPPGNMQAKPELPSLLCYLDLLLSVKIVFGICKSDLLFRREYFSVLCAFEIFCQKRILFLDCFKA